MLLRSLAALFQAAIGVAAWLLFVNATVIVTHAQLGFCRNAEELSKPEPNCPAPWWYWAGNIAVPIILVGGAVWKIRNIAKDDQN